MRNRFDLYGALHMFCTNYHSGLGSRGYRILSRLKAAGYNPGLSVEAGRFESDEMHRIYRHLVRNYSEAV